MAFCDERAAVNAVNKLWWSGKEGRSWTTDLTHVLHLSQRGATIGQLDKVR